MPNRIFPVASPALLKGRPLLRVDDIRGHVLIRVDAPPRDGDWRRWLDHAGAGGLAPRKWQSFATSTHALEAATAGLGIAMAHTPFVVDSLEAGSLVPVLDIDCPDAEGDYYLVSQWGADPPRRVRLFTRWLMTCTGAVPPTA